ncbi:MAG TPA: alpha/beta hydrolase [Aeromicrobium sp.]|nr:alpha/beta hydrolase [Aeromicrobium sp.]
MDVRVGATEVHYVEHGTGRPVLILHGAGVDHREPESCFEPMFADDSGFRRVYPDLPGMGRTAATDDIDSAEDVLGLMLQFADRVAGAERYLLVGHSAGGYFAQAMADRRPDRVAGLALICPLLSISGSVPAHRVLVGSDVDLGDAQFQSYFVIHTPQMLERYDRFVAPGARLVDETAMARIGEHWELRSDGESTYDRPTLIVAGRWDSVVGYTAASSLAGRYPRATTAVVADAGHALPHEQPAVLAGLMTDWLARATSDADVT